jgi:hypothetical protein
MHGRMTRDLTNTARSISSDRALIAALAGSLLFTAAIWLLDARLDRFALAVREPGMPRFYPWMLAVQSDWAQITAWGGYLVHQIAFWLLIWWAQSQGTKFTQNLKPVNYWAFAVTAGAIVLHLAQTQLFYDGLAQDVPEWTAMWSVVLLLLVVLLVENRRRGILLGKTWGGFVLEAGDVARRYHGYYFAWATIYTFWYHPMVATSGHLLGFLYMFLLFVQGCLIYTRAHGNRWWTLTLEVLVMIHGVIVAIMNTDGMWHLFGFGLAGVFVVTQAWGLGLQRRANWWLVAAFAAGLLAFYWVWGLADLVLPFRILGGYFVALPALAAVIWLLGRLARRGRKFA